MHSLSWSPRFPHFLLVGEEQTMNLVRYLATSVLAIWLQKCVSQNNSLPIFTCVFKEALDCHPIKNKFISSWISSSKHPQHHECQNIAFVSKQTNKTIELILYSTTSSSTLVIYIYIWLDQKSFKDMPMCMYCKKSKKKEPLSWVSLGMMNKPAYLVFKKP